MSRTLRTVPEISELRARMTKVAFARRSKARVVLPSPVGNMSMLSSGGRGGGVGFLVLPLRWEVMFERDVARPYSSCVNCKMK